MTSRRVRHYASGEVWELDWSGGKWVSSRRLADDAEADELIAPALVDLQINGRAGCDFLDPAINVESIERLARGLDQDGVGRALATVTTQSFERIDGALRMIRQARDVSAAVRERLVGIHLEGPYLSPHDGPRGAHPLAHIRPPSIDEFARWQESAGGAIRLVTVSPEYAESPDFIRALVKQEVLVSLGHLDATRDQIAAAVDAGATLSTHLGNGAHGQLPRHPNYLWSQLAEDRLVAMVIADGHHLPDEVLHCFVRCKTASRIVAVSDMTGLGGMPPGLYEQSSLGAVEVLENGRLVVAGQRQYLAGAALPLWQAIGRLSRVTDLDVRQAIDACSVHPARLLGEEAELNLDDPGRCHAILLRPTHDEVAWSLRGVLRYGDVQLLAE
ncbi:MAG: amidohydrolase family protein [Planctomycetales bacterium]|nr:amidohydrolase family protein [Planctomycetales bacterium]